MTKVKYLLSLAFILSASSFGNEAQSTLPETDEEIVYVCAGTSSTCYHRIEDCRGLKTCSTTIRQVALRAAQILGRRQCKMCYKKNIRNNEETKTKVETETK